ncbi:MAG: hypothetical protein K8T90_04425, partial [Planctomycetes bacterium]|nr:hypothetical protein [Planctomycetota bacterium]
PVAALLDADPEGALASETLLMIGSLAARQIGGEVWRAWVDRIDALRTTQVAGTWPAARSGLAASQFTSTALRTLALEWRQGYVRVARTK